MQNDTRIAVDLAKAVFEVAVSERPGRISRRERLPRARFLNFFAQQRSATVVMEACGSGALLGPSHRRPRTPSGSTAAPSRSPLRSARTRRIAPTRRGFSKPAAMSSIRPVPVKTVAQQVLTSLHRLRSSWMCERTARINTLRGLLREFGFFIPVGARQVVPAVWALIEDADADVPDALRPFLAELCQEIRELEARILRVERQLTAISKQLPVVAHLLTIPGVCLLTATAMLAFIEDIRRFPSARHFASYLGRSLKSAHPTPAITGAKRTNLPHPGTAQTARAMMSRAMPNEKDSPHDPEPGARVATAATKPVTISPDETRTSVAWRWVYGMTGRTSAEVSHRSRA